MSGIDPNLWVLRPRPDQRALRGPLSVDGGSADCIVPTKQLDRWRVHSTGSCEVTAFTGDHFSMRSAADELLRSISAKLSAVM